MPFYLFILPQLYSLLSDLNTFSPMMLTSIFSLIVVLYGLSFLACVVNAQSGKEFYDACAKGDLGSVKEYIKTDPCTYRRMQSMIAIFRVLIRYSCWG